MLKIFKLTYSCSFRKLAKSIVLLQDNLVSAMCNEFYGIS